MPTVKAIGAQSDKSTGVATLDGALEKLSLLREHQWQVMRRFREEAARMEATMVELAEANTNVDKAQRALFEHLEITTRPDGEPPDLAQSLVKAMGEAVQIARGMGQVYTSNGNTYLTMGLMHLEIENCLKGNWIEAIKRVRERTGMGLKEAKDLVDGFRSANRLP